MSFLDRIVAQRRIAVASLAADAPQVRRTAERMQRRPHRLLAALGSPGLHIIAEFKRASPSAGAIRMEADVAQVAATYEAAGASALSVLTEPRFFFGSLDDLRRARAVSKLPILQKDFVVSEYQIDEAAAAGADAILLIVAALNDEELCGFRIRAAALGLDALVEVHSADEMQRAIRAGAKLIGVNNRDLRTFKTSLVTSEHLASAAPPDATLVAESGISCAADTMRLARSGYRAFLIGEALMRASDPAAMIGALRGGVVRPQVKICGVTNVEDARSCAECGVQMIGLNFSPRSRRCISLEQGRAIVAALRPEFPVVKMVGVFVDQELAFVRHVAGELALNAVQLHGDESPDYVRELEPLFVIKALRVKDGSAGDDAARYSCGAILLDTYHATARGGTGECFDWRLAHPYQSHGRRLILAGGLSSANISEAIAAVRPFAVDVCSSVESSPGRKDAEKVRQFVATVAAGK